MANSFLNQVDTRTKLILTLVGAITTIVFSQLGAQVTLFAFSFAVALMVKNYTLIAILYAFMALMMALSMLCAWIISFWVPSITDVAAQNLLIPFLRGLTMMNFMVGLALTSKIENIMTALSQFKLPFMLALPATVMIRFIPTFANDIAQVWETLKIRGWDMGAKMLICHPLLSARLIFVPIIFRALKSSEALGVAAELKALDRGFSTKEKSADTVLKKADGMLFLALLAAFALALVFEMKLLA